MRYLGEQRYSSAAVRDRNCMCDVVGESLRKFCVLGSAAMLMNKFCGRWGRAGGIVRMFVCYKSYIMKFCVRKTKLPPA